MKLLQWDFDAWEDYLYSCNRHICVSTINLLFFDGKEKSRRRQIVLQEQIFAND